MNFFITDGNNSIHICHSRYRAHASVQTSFTRVSGVGQPQRPDARPVFPFLEFLTTNQGKFLVERSVPALLLELLEMGYFRELIKSMKCNFFLYKKYKCTQCFKYGPFFRGLLWFGLEMVLQFSTLGCVHKCTMNEEKAWSESHGNLFLNRPSITLNIEISRENALLSRVKPPVRMEREKESYDIHQRGRE